MREKKLHPGMTKLVNESILGSTTVVLKADGSVQGVEKYKAFGEKRYPQSQPDLKTDHRYTGQLEVGFGLYFYQSRFYDPMAARFVSADTVVPEPGSPLAWDRYSYVQNNPVAYVDPSGHKGCVDFDKNGQCVEDPDWRTFHEVPLTGTGATFKTTDKKGGQGVEELFHQYQSTCGWWNNNCDPSTKFGINEFLGLWILFESNYNENVVDLIAIVIAQNLFVGGWNPATCNNTPCYNGVFNFIAAYSQGVGGIFAGPDNLTNQLIPINSPQFGGEVNLRMSLSKWGSKARNSNLVVLWDQLKGPSNWGNIEGGHALNIDPSKFGTNDNTVFYNIGSFVVFSRNQYDNLVASGVDVTLTLDP